MDKTEIATMVERLTKAEADRAELLAACERGRDRLATYGWAANRMTLNVMNQAMKNAEKGRTK